MLKKIIIGLGSLLLLLLLISFILPSKATTERSIIINAPEDVVFFQVSDLQKMQSWNPRFTKDPGTQFDFGSKRAGVGAVLNWKSSNTEVGKGVYKIISGDPFNKIKANLDLFDKGRGTETFLFSKVNNGIKVSWTAEMETKFGPIEKYMNLLGEGSMGEEMDKGLQAMRTNCDKIVGGRDKALQQLNQGSIKSDYNPQQVELPQRAYMAARKTVTMRNMEGHLETYFTKVYDACREKRLLPAGAHCALFYNWDDSNGTVDVAAAIPVTKEMEYSDEIKPLIIPAVKAVMVEHIGAYEKISGAHLAAQQYMQANGLNFISPVIEEYVTDGNTEPDPNKWLTKLYFLYQ